MFSLYTVIVAIGGLVFGTLLLLLPYYFNSGPLVLTISSVLGSFILSYGIIRPIQNYFLLKNQVEYTRSVLEASLTVFQDKIASSVLSNIKWVENIEEYGIKHIYSDIPRININKAIRNAKDVDIRILVFSYGLIWDWHYVSFKEALTNGCKIEVLTADPDKNCLVKYCEETDLYKDKDERGWAKRCVSGLEKIKDQLSKDQLSPEHKDNFTFRMYMSTTPIAAIEIGPSKEVPRCIWFGILWSHSQSYNGPWFEIQGNNHLSTYIHDHIDGIKRLEPDLTVGGVNG